MPLFLRINTEKLCTSSSGSFHSSNFVCQKSPSSEQYYQKFALFEYVFVLSTDSRKRTRNCVLVNVHVPINGTYTRSKYLGPGSYESSKFVRQGSYLDSFPSDNCAPA
ncbi:uncharacterized protein PGTG_04410 [Puccinia graminis f. sp. tritici CRL 75-36-700-3]|uniref:Uncharacterized protein n=1 Tax=Puccinia graminis f. sp. tritici (strain CRL 75-36-700-3 / race SCCL) TaxID=418459 RepID=E3K285_PUCGT|nr:uncharacterized protein PGTG_04410 [Puccinia graminis f. sp. tritici CRL 75-36-700-3]EFP78454.1 hypothetical protein PGTG_04410 [Puccinia graminis f. sp. tritici CRL 75-36-700-3]